MNENEIAEKIATMETEQARAREALQNALRQAEEAKAMLQRQEGYLIALRELQGTEPAADVNGQVETEILEEALA
tara:strand:+ start:882 stop:1106 length:225 start_codon:yes stop_codon:yes gene_type:complete